MRSHNPLKSQTDAVEQSLMRVIAVILTAVGAFLPINFFAGAYHVHKPNLIPFYVIMEAVAVTSVASALMISRMIRRGSHRWWHSMSLYVLMFLTSAVMLVVNPEPNVLYRGGYLWFMLLLIVMSGVSADRRPVLILAFGTAAVYVYVAYAGGNTSHDPPTPTIRGFVAFVIAAIGVVLSVIIGGNYDRIRVEHSMVEVLRRAHDGISLTDGIHKIGFLDITVAQRLRDTLTTGDFVFHRSRRGRVTILMGDVTGNGLAASPYVGYLGALFHTYVGPMEPDSIIQHLNRQARRLPIDLSFTACCLCAERVDGRAVLSYSGYQQKIVVTRADGGVEALETSGPILGLQSRVKLRLDRFKLNTGDGFLMRTDGGAAKGEDFTLVAAAYR